MIFRRRSTGARRTSNASGASRRPLYTRHYLSSCALTLITLATCLLLRPSLLSIARDQVFDAYQRAAPRAWGADAGVRIVDIDDRSLEELGQWPWPRTRLAELVEHLQQDRAAAIGFDIAFSEPDRTSIEGVISGLPAGETRSVLMDLATRTPAHDTLFADALQKLPVVLGTVLTNDASGSSLPKKFGLAKVGGDPERWFASFNSALLPLTSLAAASTGLGALNWVPDADLTVRRVPLFFDLDGAPVPSLALETLRAGLGAASYVLRSSKRPDGRGDLDAIRVGDLVIDTNSRADLQIRYTTHTAGRFLSAAAVLKGRVDPREIADRLILVGSSAAALADIRATPVDPAMPGIEIQAQALENILAGVQLIRYDWAFPAEIMAGIALALLITLLLPALSVVASNLLVLSTFVAIAALSWIAFEERGMLIDPITPSLVSAAVYVVGSASLFRRSQKERRWIGDAFGRFVSPQVVQKLAADPSALALGGETRQLSVLFCDLQGFTGIVERMDARELTKFVNGYLSPMSHAVLARGGTIGKYIGDAVMAFWNAPLSDAQHAPNAVQAATDMIAALPAMQRAWNASSTEETARPTTLKCGIGIATGPCAVGNFGSDVRFEYSAMGDTVNVAARLEVATRHYGLDILASEATKRSCTTVEWLEVDVVRLKGKAQATRIYTPLCSAPFEGFEADHLTLLETYRAQDFSGAHGLAERLLLLAPDRLRGVYATYSKRCRELAEHTFDPSWDGVMDLPK